MRGGCFALELQESGSSGGEPHLTAPAGSQIFILGFCSAFQAEPWSGRVCLHRGGGSCTAFLGDSKPWLGIPEGHRDHGDIFLPPPPKPEGCSRWCLPAPGIQLNSQSLGSCLEVKGGEHNTELQWEDFWEGTAKCPWKRSTRTSFWEWEAGSAPETWHLRC